MRRFFGAWWIIVFTGQAALAQGPQLSRLEPTTGFIEAVGPGMLQILEGHGTRWTVRPAPNARVEVLGSTTREMLQKGQFVSCEVMLDDAGKVAEPATAVVFTGGGSGVAPAGAQEAAAGGQPALKPQPRGKRPAGAYLIAGQLKLVKDDVMTVLAGKERFEITVAPDAIFSVNTTNVALAAKGDPVEMEGVYQTKGQLLATVLKIKLANPVLPAPSKGARMPVGQP